MLVGHTDHPDHPPSSFGRAQGRGATATLANASECSRYPLFGLSTAATSQSRVAPQSPHRSPPTPLAPAQLAVTCRIDPGHSQQSHGATDKREFEVELFEESEDLTLNPAFFPSTSLTTKKDSRAPAYHYIPSTTASRTAVTGDKIRERAPTPELRSRTPSQPSFNSTGVGSTRLTNNTSISGTPSWSDSRSGGYSQSFSTRDSALSSDFSAPSAAASTPNTQLYGPDIGLEADAKWLSGVGYDGARSAHAFSRSRNNGPATLMRDGDVVLMGTARSGHWVNHLVIQTRREHIAGRYYVDPSLDVLDHATPLKTNSRNPTYRLPRLNSFSEGAPAKGKPGSQATPWKPGATANQTTCHALIDSKSGNIDVKLHVGGLGEERAKKALMDVRTKTGKLRVKLIELSGGRRVHLDVVTGKGNIEVFLPRSFNGPLHVHSVAGEITVLPRLASTMEVVAAREGDALVMVSPAPPTPWTVLSDDDSSSVEGPPATPIEEGMPPETHYFGQTQGSLTAISETNGPTAAHSNPRPRVGSPSPKPRAKYTQEQDDGRFRRNGRPLSPPFDLNELRPNGTNGFGAGAQLWNGDSAGVVSTKGNVVVGFVGEDVESGKEGFWKGLIGAFKRTN